MNVRFAMPTRLESRRMFDKIRLPLNYVKRLFLDIKLSGFGD